MGRRGRRSRCRPLARELHLQTDGNAFFVTEVVRYLKESGRLDALDEASGRP